MIANDVACINRIVNESPDPPPVEEILIAVHSSKQAPPTPAEVVLSLLLKGAPEAYLAAKDLKPEDFLKKTHKLIFQAINARDVRGIPCDVITISQDLEQSGSFFEAGGAAIFERLSAVDGKTEMVLEYVDCLRTASQKRKQLKAVDAVRTAISTNGDVSGASQVFLESMTSTSKTASVVGDLLSDFFKQIQARKSGEINGIPSGISVLDKATNGFQSGNFILVAARPSMGKTALAINFCQHAAGMPEPTPVGIFSLEMTKAELMARIMTAESQVFSHKFASGAFSDLDWPALATAADKVFKMPLYIDDTPALEINELCSRARKWVHQDGVRMIAIDYLQLIRNENSENRQQEISEISRSLKALAKELKIPVIALSQLNRELEKRGDKRPVMSDLRESGAIEQDADLILFIYREAVYCDACRKQNGSCTQGHERSAEIIVGKFRNGVTPIIPVEFFGPTQQFLPEGTLATSELLKTDKERAEEQKTALEAAKAAGTSARKFAACEEVINNRESKQQALFTAESPISL